MLSGFHVGKVGTTLPQAVRTKAGLGTRGLGEGLE